MQIHWKFIIELLTIALICHTSSLAQHPNVLIIVSEDNGPELGCYGDKHARTPNLDRLAEQGIRFNRAFTSQAGCSQSRATIMTGLYPHQHGQIGLATWGFRLYREDTFNLPRALKDCGYRTGIIGKLHINPESAFPFDFEQIPTANFNRKNLRDYIAQADKFMRQDDRPFFLSVNFPDAHDPWLRQVDGLPADPQTGDQVQAMPYMGIDPPGMREMVADYYNSLSRLDTLVGELLSALEKSGKANDTIVVYLGDHGADMLRGKRTCFEGGLRIPLLIRWPNHIAPQVRQEMVSTIDLLPTILTAVGATVPDQLPGSPLQPLFTPGAVPWRKYYCAEYHTHGGKNNYFPQRSIRSERFKMIENLLEGEVHPDYDLTISKLEKEAKARKITGGLDLHAEIAKANPTVQNAYLRMRKPPRFELFDLSLDPFELHNLAELPEHAEVLKELQKELLQWRTETNDPLLNPKALEKLNAEVRSVKKKGEAQEINWSYPDYFFEK
jgi:N-sulfoglucosamine sulfohydrolase